MTEVHQRNHHSSDSSAGFSHHPQGLLNSTVLIDSSEATSEYQPPISTADFNLAQIERVSTCESACLDAVTSQHQKTCLADQSEEFALAVPSDGPQSERKILQFRRESLRALMSRGDPEHVFDEYYQGYRRCFTDPNEVESKPALRELLEIGKGDWDISVVTLDGQIIAGYHTKLAKISSFDLGLFSVGDYLWADKSMRGFGIGQFLYARTMEFRQSQGAQGHFGEIRDVNLLPQKELMRDWKAGTTSQQRIGFWKKQDRMVLDAPWIQPALSEGQNEIDFYMLTLSVLSDACPRVFPSEAYLELWTKFYPLHKNSPTLETLRQLITDSPGIQVQPIDEPRTYIRAVRLPKKDV